MNKNKNQGLRLWACIVLHAQGTELRGNCDGALYDEFKGNISEGDGTQRDARRIVPRMMHDTTHDGVT